MESGALETYIQIIYVYIGISNWTPSPSSKVLYPNWNPGTQTELLLSIGLVTLTNIPGYTHELFNLFCLLLLLLFGSIHSNRA